MTNQEHINHMREVIGVGSLEGWTRTDILEQATLCRAACCSTAYSANDREQAIETMTTLIMGCGDLDLATGILASILLEMQKRHSILCFGPNT